MGGQNQINAKEDWPNEREQRVVIGHAFDIASWSGSLQVETDRYHRCSQNREEVDPCRCSDRLPEPGCRSGTERDSPAPWPRTYDRRCVIQCRHDRNPRRARRASEDKSQSLPIFSTAQAGTDVNFRGQKGHRSYRKYLGSMSPI